MKQIEFDGSIHEFPDDFTDADIQQALGNQVPPPDTFSGKISQAMNALQQFGGDHPYVRAAAHLLVPSLMGADIAGGSEVGKGAIKQIGASAHGLLQTAGPIGMAADFAAKKLGLDPKIDAALTPSNDLQRAGGYGAMAAEAAIPLPRLLDMVPSAARAGKNFDKVAQVVGNAPVDLTDASAAAIRAQQLGTHGATTPKIVNDLLPRLPQHSPFPMNYNEVRDFASNAGRLSVQDKLASNPMMQREVSKLAKALDSAAGTTAEQGGVGDLYQKAMSEYRNAMRIQAAKQGLIDIGKSNAFKYGAGGAAAAGGYSLWNKIFGQ